jgi:hypothetical protein
VRFVRNLITFGLLVIIKLLSQIFFRIDMRWIGNPAGDPWADIRVAAILNHTSLFEPIFAGGIPFRFAWRIARHAVIPVASITIERPVVGKFFRLIAGHVVPITRKRDDTWKRVLSKVDDEEAMIVILPEGRMKRKDGLDSQGKPMTVRGGIADILLGIPEGRMILAYSKGLHHVQAPGEKWPRLFKRVHMELENLDLAKYRDTLLEARGPEGFRQAVVDDLTRRRDLHCPTESNHPDTAPTEA